MAETNYLKNFVDGELIKATEINDNNQYILDKISDSAGSMQQYIATQIATVNSTLNNTKTELNNQLENITKILNENGIYSTTYINGTSWYREYFSDAEKTNRVWLEQGGVVTTSGQKDVVFPKEFTDTNYTLTLGAITTHYSGYVWFPTINSKSTTGAQIAGNWSGGGDSYAYFNWMACGK